jgi:hypothetical protein
MISTALVVSQRRSFSRRAAFGRKYTTDASKPEEASTIRTEVIATKP